MANNITPSFAGLAFDYLRENNPELSKKLGAEVDDFIQSRLQSLLSTSEFTKLMADVSEKTKKSAAYWSTLAQMQDAIMSAMPSEK